MKRISTSVHTVIDAAGGTLVRVLFVSAVALILTACASMSEKECLSANWKDQGYRDGRAGQPLIRLEDHREACAKVGVTPDVEQYRAGRDVGVLEYCAPANAVREGRLGRSYRNACPMNLERSFLAYYERGYRAYEAQQRVETLNREMQRIQRVLEKEKNESRRRELRRELRHLDNRLLRARNELHDEETRLQLHTP